MWQFNKYFNNWVIKKENSYILNEETKFKYNTHLNSINALINVSEKTYDLT